MDRYLEYTNQVSSPQTFRLWSVLFSISAAAERRIWTEIGLDILFPNLYVILVGPAGTGKSRGMRPAMEVLRKSRACILAPNDMSKQGLLDSLSKAERGVMIDGSPYTYHYMAVFISELSNFMAKYDAQLAGVLTDLYDNPDINEESKRHGLGKEINFPGISVLLGTATGNLGASVPHEAWDSGFMARFILVHSEEKIIPPDMFAKNHSSRGMEAELVERFKRIGAMKGEMAWTREAQGLLQDLREEEGADGPQHPRLIHYLTRRWMHVAKLCMVSALADERMVVEAEDFHQALSWLLPAELEMPTIFSGMVRSEDGALLLELHAHLLRTFPTSPIPAKIIYEFLALRTRAVQIDKLLDIAINAGYLRRVAGTSGGTAEYVVGRKG